MKNEKPTKARLPVFAQLTHSIGLNDVCDTLRIHARWLGSLRGAVAPTRNTLSHASKTRDSEMMEALFWKTLSHLEGLVPGGFGIRYNGLPRRFRKAVHAVDSSTIVMVFITNNTQWAPSSVGELYQARWGIEVFFKQIKQTLQLCDFLGHSKRAQKPESWASVSKLEKTGSPKPTKSNATSTSPAPSQAAMG